MTVLQVACGLAALGVIGAAVHFRCGIEHLHDDVPHEPLRPCLDSDDAELDRFCESRVEGKQ